MKKLVTELAQRYSYANAKRQFMNPSFGRAVNYILDKVWKDIFARHVVMVHLYNNCPEVEVEGILSIHYGEFAAKRREKELYALRPEGSFIQFKVFELGRVRTPYVFDTWLPQYVSASWMRMVNEKKKRVGIPGNK